MPVDQKIAAYSGKIKINACSTPCLRFGYLQNLTNHIFEIFNED